MYRLNLYKNSEFVGINEFYSKKSTISAVLLQEGYGYKVEVFEGEDLKYKTGDSRVKENEVELFLNAEMT